MFIVQWVAAPVLPLFFFFGRSLIGSPLGWLTVFGMFYAWKFVALLLVPPVLTLFDRSVRGARRTRTAYTISVYVLCAAVFVMSIAVNDGGDSGDWGSALSVWSGGAISDGVTAVVSDLSLGVTAAAYLAMIVTAIVGIIAGARTRDSPPTA